MTNKISVKERTARRKAMQDVASLPVVDLDWAPIDDAVGYEVGKIVNLAQLQSEINALSSVAVTNTALSGPDDSAQAISDSNYVVLWVAPQGVDAGAVAQAVTAHVPNPNWGIPQVILDFNSILQSLRTDPDVELSDDDKDSLLRGLALNFSMIVNPSGS